MQLDRHALPTVEALLCRLAASDNILAVMEVAGPFYLALLVTVAHMDAFNALCDDLLAGDPVVRRYESRFIKKRRKFTTALPLAKA
jgi:Lrp/AsnC family leucine-responsive transcriptional regulator